MTRPDSERGSATIEVVIIVPALMLFVALLIAAGRVQLAHQSVDAAAAEAARAASISRTAASARAEATTAARHSLTNQDLDCATTSVTLDTSAFGTAVGTAGQVHATVTCSLPLGDLGVPGLSGTKTITATMSSPLDTYRER